MKKIEKTSEVMWLLGTVFVALGVAICSKADLGVSMIAAPAFIIQEAVSKVFSFMSVGVTEYVFQGILLIIMCIAVKRFNWRYLLAFLVAVLYGYTLNFFLWVLGGISFDAVWLRWVMLIVGDTVTAFGVACFFKTYMPLQVYELFVAEISSRYKFSINKTKMIFDYSLLTVSIILALVLFGDVASFDWLSIYKTSFHSIGLGTLVTTLINSPIIAFWGKILDKTTNPTPAFPKLYGFLKR